MVLIRRELLNDGTFDPIVEGPQALDLALGLAPISTAFGHRIVVSLDHIMNRSRWAMSSMASASLLLSCGTDVLILLSSADTGTFGL
jgi:hypothetical protein